MRHLATLAAAVVGSSLAGAIAADWPQAYGPRRDSSSEQQRLLRAWPPEGPRTLWRLPLGAGFGGPAVRDGKVYVLDRDEKVGDTLRVLDLASGQVLWTFSYDAPGSFMFPGSRTTPTLAGDLAYTCGPLGDLYAVHTTTRRPVWHKNIWKDFGGGDLPRWAIVQHPLVYGDLLIVAPQTSQAGVVAYDRLTGELRWRSPPLSGTTGYVSPSIAKIAGEDHVVMVTASIGRGRAARDGSVNGIDPRSGKLLWSYGNWQCPIPVPPAVDAGEGRLLITGAYSAGSAMIQVQKKADGSFGVTELYKNPDFGSHTQPPTLYKGHFYSHYTINERSDGLVAMSMDGQVKWKTERQPPFVRGGSVLADGLLLATDGDTKLYLVEPDPSAFKPLASAVVLETGDNWAPLALVDGKLLVRGQKQLVCLQVAQ
jgi:outer membrane protein assembly factor BamB